MEYLPLISRWIHILSAIALLGGALFAVVVVLPSLRVLDEGLRSSLMEVLKKRAYRITHPAILLLLATGMYNFMSSMDVYKQVGSTAHMLIGIKLLLALGILAVLMGQTFGVLKGCPSRWMKLNIAMGLIIVLLAGFLRHLRLEAMGL
jgi:uncharacterized membrane protein